MRNYQFIDQYLTSLYSDIYEQSEDVGHTKLAQKVIDHWGSRLTTCHSVLDVGCGQGMAQPMWEKWGMEYYGCAIGEDVIKAQELGRNVKKMDFSFLDFEDSSFDLVFSRHSAEHAFSPLLALMEWHRVSKSWLGLVVPAPEHYGVSGRNHYYVLYKEQWENLLNQSGWNVLWYDEYSDDGKQPWEYWFFCEKTKRKIYK